MDKTLIEIILLIIMSNIIIFTIGFILGMKYIVDFAKKHFKENKNEDE
jgi:hypothetical protein